MNMNRKLVSIVCLVLLLLTPTIPVQAQGITQAENDSISELGWIEPFEKISPQTNSLQLYGFSPMASGCLTYTLGVNGYSLAGIKIWSYAWNISWCYNGTTITSVSKWRTVWANYGWSFKGDIAENHTGGVNKSFYWHYAQGDFCFIETYTCVTHSYPWVDQTVFGNGTYSGNVGGN